MRVACSKLCGRNGRAIPPLQSNRTWATLSKATAAPKDVKRMSIRLFWVLILPASPLSKDVSSSWCWCSIPRGSCRHRSPGHRSGEGTIRTASVQQQRSGTGPGGWHPDPTHGDGAARRTDSMALWRISCGREERRRLELGILL